MSLALPLCHLASPAAIAYGIVSGVFFFTATGAVHKTLGGTTIDTSGVKRGGVEPMESAHTSDR